MAYFGVTATTVGLGAADGGFDLAGRLGACLADLPEGAPVVILVHGYKFDPGTPGCDPHRSLYAYRAGDRCRKVRSWPEGLGFAAEGGATGLCIGFGWPAVSAHLPNLWNTGRNGFAHVYDRAAAFGSRLAQLIALIQELAPERPIDLLAHSLGARLALAALPHLDAAPDRMILLGAAEFGARARAALRAMRAPRPPQIYNVTARANDFYDAMFEHFAPRKSTRERALGFGLGRALPSWLDLQLDRAEVTDWINGRGIPLKPASARLCHWSFYTRDGAFAVYQAILRRKPGWDIASLREVSCFAAQEPRWSRLLPGVRRAESRWRGAVSLEADLGSA